MKILVVEDELRLNELIVSELKERGFVVDSAQDGREGEYLASVNAYDVVVLDVMLPERNGFEVLKNLRAKEIMVPVLFLTSLGDTTDKVQGLDMGADDYLVKPFDFDELVARIRSLSRRPPQFTDAILRIEDLSIDTRSQSVTIAGKEVSLTLREYLLLEYLLRHRGDVVTREDILEHVWDRFFDSLSNVVDVHIKNLRKKLPKKYAKYIQTVWGKGYRIL